MKRDEAVALMEHFARDIKHAGTTTAPYHGYNGWMAFVVKNSRFTHDSTMDWEVPGLFVSYAELNAAPRPYLTVFYRMGCGRVLVLTLPVVRKNGDFKIPNNLTVLKKRGIFNGEEGMWIALEHWTVVGNVNDFVVKKGAKLRQHLAKKPEKAARS